MLREKGKRCKGCRDVELVRQSLQRDLNLDQNKQSQSITEDCRFGSFSLQQATRMSKEVEANGSVNSFCVKNYPYRHDYFSYAKECHKMETEATPNGKVIYAAGHTPHTVLLHAYGSCQ